MKLVMEEKRREYGQTAGKRREGRGMTEQQPETTQPFLEHTTLTQRLPWRRTRFTTSA